MSAVPTNALSAHFRRHARFYCAALIGGAAWYAMPQFHPSVRMLLAGDAFFATHILSTVVVSMRSRHASFLERVRQEDEGIVVISLIGGVTVIVTLGRVFELLSRTDRPAAILFALSLASVPLGWTMIHTLFAYHYANEYYSPPRQGERARALSFQGDDEPRAWDFLYFAFVIAMTAQVSDVSVVSTRMRRLVLIQGVISFFFNTIILAIAVNVGVDIVRH